ncbi:MAG: hypothetical protein WD871_08215 [Xanthobacteraceae bacterium]
MRIVFSRKGFDSQAGGYPSPILDGRPISIPIPTRHRSETTYEHLGLGELVERLTRGKIARDHLCHEDPMFADGRCAFGQTGPAQSHLTNCNVGIDDIFLFFGLFSDARGERHHRIFGYLKVEKVLTLGTRPNAANIIADFPRRHPHTIGEWNTNNTVYLGAGFLCQRASDTLRLSIRGGPVSVWSVPPWLREAGLTYHGDNERWLDGNMLKIVGRGQEFVTHVDAFPVAHQWLDRVIAEINR